MRDAHVAAAHPARSRWWRGVCATTLSSSSSSVSASASTFPLPPPQASSAAFLRPGSEIPALSEPWRDFRIHVTDPQVSSFACCCSLLAWPRCANVQLPKQSL
jgi:hypothetical protein